MPGAMGGMSLKERKDRLYELCMERHDTTEARERYESFLSAQKGILLWDEIVEIHQLAGRNKFLQAAKAWYVAEENDIDARYDFAQAIVTATQYLTSDEIMTRLSLAKFSGNNTLNK